jgi:hypothetical protein
VNRGHFENVFQLAPLESTFRVMAHGTAPGHDTTVNPYGPNSPMLRTMMSGRSTFNCYEVMQLKRTAVAGRPLVYPDGDVRLFETVFAPNRVQFSVAAGQAPSRVFLNQNFANGWTSNAGPVSLDPAEGQLVATLAPGQTGRFWFEFTPAGFAPGMGLLALAIGASAIAWKRNVVL